MAAAVSREISGTKAVEPRYIQATYTEPHCSDTSNCRDSAEVALSQVEDSRQFSQFSWKGVLFFLDGAMELHRKVPADFWCVTFGEFFQFVEDVRAAWLRGEILESETGWRSRFKTWNTLFLFVFPTLKLNLRIFAPCMVILEAFAMAGSDN